jgi:hypothetical protein
MRFWDTSAIVPLVILEDTSEAALQCLREDDDLAVWWTTSVECASAIARLEREGMTASRAAEGFARLDTLAATWTEVEPHNEIREIARRLLRVHPLRAADALQLAAAYIVAERRPSSLEIVTLDDRLFAAAVKEGFRILKP